MHKKASPFGSFVTQREMLCFIGIIFSDRESYLVFLVMAITAKSTISKTVSSILSRSSFSPPAHTLWTLSGSCLSNFDTARLTEKNVISDLPQ